jgi:hypothetical protein
MLRRSMLVVPSLNSGQRATKASFFPSPGEAVIG